MDYKKMIKFLSKKRKSKEITEKLGISERSWRRLVNRTNETYGDHDVLIIGDNGGYKATTDKQEVYKYAMRLIRHGVSEIKNGKKIIKALGNLNQLSLEQEDVKLVDLVKKMKL